MERSVRPELCVIAVYEETTRVMGRAGALVWELPSDMRRFVELTTGQVVVMGRRTWQSIGGRAFPNRHNLVLSKELGEQQGAVFFDDFEEALHHALRLNVERVCFIGGEEVFERALKVADMLYLTLVSDPTANGDVHFPPFDENEFEKIGEELRSERGLAFRFLTLKRKTAVS